MKQLPCIKSVRKERGDFLIESLIGVLLIGIVGVGIAMTAKKVNTSQTMSHEQSLAISNMAGAAKGGDLDAICSGTGVTNMGGFTFDADKSTCESGTNKPKTITLTIDGKSVVMPKPITMEAKKSVEDPNGGTDPIEVVVRVGQ